jgi:hypothetical protein
MLQLQRMNWQHRAVCVLSPAREVNHNCSCSAFPAVAELYAAKFLASSLTCALLAFCFAAER